MSDYGINIIGFAAAILTTVAFVPQVVKVVKTRSTRDISLLMYLIFSFGISLWLVYGILLKAWPIVFANSLTLILALVIILFKLKEDK